jgi:hypothetical protein
MASQICRFSKIWSRCSQDLVSVSFFFSSLDLSDGGREIRGFENDKRFEED